MLKRLKEGISDGTNWWAFSPILAFSIFVSSIYGIQCFRKATTHTLDVIGRYDFNNDGEKDRIVACPNLFNNKATLKVLDGDGPDRTTVGFLTHYQRNLGIEVNPTFTRKYIFSLVNSASISDINYDGKPDLILASGKPLPRRFNYFRRESHMNILNQ